MKKISSRSEKQSNEYGLTRDSRIGDSRVAISTAPPLGNRVMQLQQFWFELCPVAEQLLREANERVEQTSSSESGSSRQ
jgi:hypothetical protein